MLGSGRTREALQIQAAPPVQQGVEERQLQQGDWQRERNFLLTLAVRAFPSVTGVPLKFSVSPLHTSVRGKGCLAGCSGTVCAGNPAQAPQPRRGFQRGCGNEPC